MTRFREHRTLGIHPEEWSTAGFLAATLMVSSRAETATN